jgi:hypothetical protein
VSEQRPSQFLWSNRTRPAALKTFSEIARYWYGIASTAIWLAAAAAVIGGVGVALHTDETTDFFSSTKHPWVAAGVGIIIVGLFFAIVAQAVLACLWAIVSNTVNLPEAELEADAATGAGA